jgi:hypothetical protein
MSTPPFSGRQRFNRFIVNFSPSINPFFLKAISEYLEQLGSNTHRFPNAGEILFWYILINLTVICNQTGFWGIGRF